jgi:transcriptional regulator with XRE-family HTH domain
MELISINAVQKFMMDNELSKAAFARRLGVSRSLVVHILHGKRQPSSTFIARFKEAFPDQPLEKYFFILSVAQK